MTLGADDVERILDAVETIEVSLSVLVEKQSISRETYQTDRESRDVVERRFVKLTEATLDIARTLVSHERGAPPKSNPAAMVALDDAGVFARTTATEMVQAARFRNVLTHTRTATLSTTTTCTPRYRTSNVTGTSCTTFVDISRRTTHSDRDGRAIDSAQAVSRSRLRV